MSLAFSLTVAPLAKQSFLTTIGRKNQRAEYYDHLPNRPAAEVEAEGDSVLKSIQEWKAPCVYDHFLEGALYFCVAVGASIAQGGVASREL